MNHYELRVLLASYNSHLQQQIRQTSLSGFVVFVEVSKWSSHKYMSHVEAGLVMFLFLIIRL